MITHSHSLRANTFILLTILFSISITSAQNTTNQSFNGTITGQFSVDATGTANYSIPLDLSPGINQVAPSLSIAYTSQGNNSLIGYGFSLSGISAINRVGASIPEDGFRGAVNYDDNDRFTLDGGRLMNINSINGKYCFDGAMYMTQEQSWQKIVAYGTQGSGPASFTVTQKDGTLLKYGYTSDSKTLANGSAFSGTNKAGSIREWLICSSQDLNGNTINYKYTLTPASANGLAIQGTGQMGYTYLDTIYYTSNGTTQAMYAISFIYEPRPDTLVRFQGGAAVSIPLRLKKITLNLLVANNRYQPQYAYILDYENDKNFNVSRLSLITKTGKYGASTAPLQFYWTSGANSLVSRPANFTSGIPAMGSFISDINGDGKNEILSNVNNSAINGYYHVTPGGMVFEKFTNTIPISTQTYVADFNGDGLSDILTNKGIWMLYFNTGGAFDGGRQVSINSMATSVSVADANGDGMADIFQRNSNTEIDLYIANGLGFNSPKQLMVYTPMSNQYYITDFNGDNQADIFANNTSSGNLYLSDMSHNGIYNQGIAIKYIPLNSTSPASNMVADFNGDGLNDILTYTQSAFTLYYSNGTGFQPGINPGSIILNNAQNWLSDFNGDGAMDFYTLFGNQAYIYYFTANGFKKQLYKSPLITPNNTWFADFNGDGAADFISNDSIYYSGNASSNQVPTFNQAPHLLTVISNGIGGMLNIQYRPMSDTIIYSQGNSSNVSGINAVRLQNNYNSSQKTSTQTSNYPYSHAQSSMYLVSNYLVADGRGNSYPYSYKYSGSLTDIQRYGWLGFRSYTKTDISAGNSITTFNLQQFPYTGKTEYVITTDLNKNWLTRTRNYYNASYLTRGGLNSQIYQVTQSKIRNDAYDYGTYTYTTGMDYKYDYYGNNTQKAYLGDTSTFAHVLYHNTSYVNDTINWRIGFIKYTSQSADSLGNQVLNQEKYTYNSVNYNLTDDSIWINTNNTWLKKSYQYDSYGNTVKTIDQSGDTSIMVYDNTNHIFPAAQLSPPNQWGQRLANYFTYDVCYGTINQTTDANGNIFNIVIDQFGRDSLLMGPDSTGKSVILSKVRYLQTDTSGYTIQQITRRTWDGIIWDTTETIYDGLGRSYLGISRNANRQLVYKQQVLNSNNKIVKKSEPYLQGDSILWTTFTYDPYQRIVQLTYYQNKNELITNTITHKGKTASLLRAYGTADSLRYYAYYDFYNGKKKVIKFTNPMGKSTQYAYSILGQDTSIVDPAGYKTSMAYNSIGNLVKTQNPSSGTNTILYDYAERKVIQINNRNDSIINQYDPLQRPLKVSYGKNGGYSLQYDIKNIKNGLSNLCRVIMSDSTFTRSLSYDSYNHPISTDISINGNIFSEKYNYYPDGNIGTLTYPDGSVATYLYNQNGSLQKILLADNAAANKTPQPFITYQQYDNSGNEQLVLYGNNVTRKAAFNIQNQPSSYKISSPNSNMLYQVYKRNKVGEIVTLTDSLNFNLNQYFHYQPSGRLDTAVGAYGNIAFRYDDAGNLLAKGDNSFTYQNYQVISGAYKGAPLFTSTYDSNGNLQNRTIKRNDSTQTSSYNFDILNRLSNIVTEKDTMLSFSYDYSGQRILKENHKNQVSTMYITPNYEITITPDSTIGTKYISTGLYNVASVTHAKSRTNNPGGKQYNGIPATGILYFHQDILNSTRLTTNATGSVVNKLNFAPYGEPYEVGDKHSTFRYTFGSKELDESGMYYFSARYYDPLTTRFISADNQAGGGKWQTDAFNRYAYTINNPIKYSDPSGHGILSDIEIAFILGFEAGIEVVTDGAASSSEASIDETLEFKKELRRQAKEEVGKSFFKGLATSRVENQLSENEAVSMYKAKRALRSGTNFDEMIEMEDPKTSYFGIRSSGRDIFGNKFFENTMDYAWNDEIEEYMNLEIGGGTVHPDGEIETIGHTLQNTGEEYHKFVIDTKNYKLYIGEDALKHSHLTGNSSVYSAGTVKIKDGQLILKNITGHYKTPPESLRMSFPIWNMMKQQGYIDFENIIISSF